MDRPQVSIPPVCCAGPLPGVTKLTIFDKAANVLGVGQAFLRVMSTAMLIALPG